MAKKKRNLAMDRASARIDVLYRRVGAARELTIALSNTIDRFDVLSTDLSNEAKRLISRIKDLNDEVSHELAEISTITHKDNWRVMAKADGVEIVECDQE